MPVVCPGVCPGGGMLAAGIDSHIISIFIISFECAEKCYPDLHDSLA